MSNLEKFSDAWDIASFIGKALYGIANNRPFTEKDAKDAIDAVNAVAKLGTDYIVSNHDESKNYRDFFNIISEVGKSGIDMIPSADGGGEE